MILALTATLNRLDGKEILLNKYCPVCDVITLEECIENNWASPYKEYKVMLEVDLTNYIEAHRAFLDFFSFFNYDFNFAMKCVTDREVRAQYAKVIKNKNEDEKEVLKKVTANAFGFLVNLKKRKAFVMEHPKKIEITNLIIENRLDKKIVTFSPTIKMAGKIKYGNLLNSGIKKKKRRITLAEFILQDTGVLNSNKSINTGSITNVYSFFPGCYVSSLSRNLEILGTATRKITISNSCILRFICCRCRGNATIWRIEQMAWMDCLFLLLR